MTLHAWYIMHGICTIHTYISYTAHTVHVIDTSFSSHSRSRTLLTRASLLDAGNNGLWARRGSRRNILQETGTFHVQLRTRCSCCSSFGVSQSREVTHCGRTLVPCKALTRKLRCYVAGSPQSLVPRLHGSLF